MPCCAPGLDRIAVDRHGFDRCQVLGLPANATGDSAATMIVPARPEQRLQPLPKSALSAADE